MGGSSCWLQVEDDDRIITLPLYHSTTLPLYHHLIFLFPAASLIDSNGSRSLDSMLSIVVNGGWLAALHHLMPHLQGNPTCHHHLEVGM
jgi:hypothetical protein